MYLPHLRNAVYQQLITADNLLDRASGRSEPFVEATAEDFNFDGRQEVQLANNRLLALIAPSRGGQLYELDVRSICHNLLATLTRRPEAYHRKVLAGNDGRNDVAGISDRVVFKHANLDQRLQYDASPRKSLLDHFYDPGATLTAVARGEAAERGDFLNRPYEARVRRNPDRIQVQLSSARGTSTASRIRITKEIDNAGSRGSSTGLEIAYLLEGLRPERPVHFAIEMNFAGLPSGADDRYFYGEQHRRLGQLLGTRGSTSVSNAGSSWAWWTSGSASTAASTISRPAGIWTFPIETVSQSEGGFELVHQSVVVKPHWHVQPDAEGRWSTTLQLAIDTTQAESRQERQAIAITR